MKTYFIYIAALVISLNSCNSTKWASADSYSDDLYFSANDKPLVVSNDYIPVFSENEVKRENRKEVNSMQSKYLKENPNYSIEQVTGDFSDIQTSYSQLLSNDSISDIDTVLYYNDETGYWVDGFEGSAMDLDYATRLIRFHGPYVGVPYWSPLYTDVLFFNTWDWNVYVDNNYVYAFPTYTNSFYWNTGYRYGRMGFGFGWGYSGYGWGYPGYGYGYPWYGCGYPSYGYHPGYGCGYPGYGYPGNGSGYPSDNYYYGARVTNPTTGRMNAKQNSVANGPRTANATSLKGVSSTRTITTISPDNNLEIKKGSNTYTRVSRSNQVQLNGAKKSVTNRPGSSSNGSVSVRTTRKSYSSYSQSTSTKRPTFNRSTSSRSTSTTRRSNSSSSSGSSSIYSAPRRSSSSSVRSSQTSSRSSSTYKTGSSKSSSYSPSKSYSSSSSKSSYSSPSRSSRSSGSSYSSSGSSSSSSGSSRSSSSSSSTRSSRGSR